MTPCDSDSEDQSLRLLWLIKVPKHAGYSIYREIKEKQTNIMKNKIKLHLRTIYFRNALLVKSKLID